jgi:hypothetical protein
MEIIFAVLKHGGIWRHFFDDKVDKDPSKRIQSLYSSIPQWYLDFGLNVSGITSMLKRNPPQPNPEVLE